MSQYPVLAPSVGTDRDWGSSLRNYRNVLTVVTSLTVLQAAMAALAITVALNLREAGHSNLVLGLVAAAFSGGFLVGTQISPREIARIGHIRAFAFFAALAALAGLALGLAVHPLVWGLVQVVLGLCCAGILTSGDSWIADASPSHRRGAIIGFYHLVSKTGAIAGPFLVTGVISGLGAFMVVAALFIAALLPVTATRRAAPEISTATPFGPRQILNHAPAAAMAAFTAGAVNNAVLQLYPVFTSELGLSAPQPFAAQFNAALLAGAMIGLWPAGLVSDRIDRRLVITALAVIGAISAAGLFASASLGWTGALLLLAGLFGAGSQSYYAIAVAHAADRASHDQATAMMAGLLMLWGLGSVVGPVLAGLVMTTPLGAPGLFAFASLTLAALAVATLTRAARRSPVEEREKEPFAAAPATSYAIAEFDPRGETEDEQLDLFESPPEETPS